jgi:ATP-dependent Lon protease
MSPRTPTDKKSDVLGILPLQDAVLFPNTVIPLAVVKKPGIALVEEALRDGRPIGLVALRDKDVEDPEPSDLRQVGTIGTIQRMIKVPDGTIRCIVGGNSVFRILDMRQTTPFMAATVIELPDETRENDELVAMHRNLASLFSKLIGFLPQAPREREMEVNNITDSNLLTYFIA